MRITNSEFLLSAVDAKEFPRDDLPEIAFAGRSNVGKSSLINAIGCRKDLARVSKHPGKTASLNFYLINNKIRFVDFPGYGYAKISKSTRIEWKEMVEAYFSVRRALKLVLILVDSRRGAAEEEEQLFEYLELKKIPVIVVFTKSDKLNTTERKQIEQDFPKNILMGKAPFIIISAKDREKIQQLLRMISDYLDRS